MVRAALLNMVTHGIAIPRAEPVPAVARAGARPSACPLARIDAARGAQLTVNLRHERVDLDDFARFVLPLLDGSRDAAAIAAAVAAGARNGRIVFDRNGGPVGDPAEQGQISAEKLNVVLPMIARAALLRA